MLRSNWWLPVWPEWAKAPRRNWPLRISTFSLDAARAVVCRNPSLRTSSAGRSKVILNVIGSNNQKMRLSWTKPSNFFRHRSLGVTGTQGTIRLYFRNCPPKTATIFAPISDWTTFRISFLSFQRPHSRFPCRGNTMCSAEYGEGFFVNRRGISRPRADSWLAVPAQPVDATPSNRLIHRYFPWRTESVWLTRPKPSQGIVSADLT